MMDLDLTSKTDHVPVLIGPIIENISPVTGVWVDATFGAGGYTKALLDAGAEFVFAIDRDPNVFSLAKKWLDHYPDRIEFVNDVFSNLEKYVDDVNGVVFDLGVSSMQLDQATRGFSFLKEGPLDMRMSQTGPTAADLVNSASEKMLSNILYFFGEERASRRIAKAIVARRNQEPFGTTTDLAKIIESVLPRSKPGQSHPATRSFQALRIAVNKEYEELFNGLFSAEKVLSADGCLVVVTFHSIEDRIVKRFIQARSGKLYSTSRYLPDTDALPIQFSKVTQKAIKPSASEISINTRARSAKLRIAKRTLVGLAFWAYQENIKTKNVIAHTEKLQKEIGITRARLSILRAEWAYLNRPDRLTELVDLNFSRLLLVPLRASNFLEVDEINFLNDPDLPEVVSLPVSLTMKASSLD